MTVSNPYQALFNDLEIRSARADVAGVPTIYWRYGPSDAGIKLLVVHGFRGDHHGLEAVVAKIIELNAQQRDPAKQIQVISPDLPGFGSTPPFSGEHTLAAYRDWLVDFAKQNAAGAFVLGHSFGSIVASSAVASGLETPGLILINPIGAPALKGPRGVMTRLAISYYWLGKKLPTSLGESLLRNKAIVRVVSGAMAKTKDKELLAFIHDQHHQYFSSFANRTMLHEAFVTSVSHDVSEFAAEIQVPCLILAADKDDITTIEQARDLRTKIAGSELIEIADVGHLIHYEKPIEAAQLLSEFVHENAVANS